MNQESDESADNLKEISNKGLQEHLCGYRVTDGCGVPKTSSQELARIEEALESHSLDEGADVHVRSAQEMLSARSATDHLNCIEQSIRMLQSLWKPLTGDPTVTLEQAIKPLEDKDIIQPALQSALTRFYDYTSAFGGIRHAMHDEPSLMLADSIIMLAACTAFANELGAMAKT